ncbi:MAG: DUF4411 family protein [Hyphomicrobiales bacterium]|nr:DUF4411 family protein [Hyphomicrobiales bacterium]
MAVALHSGGLVLYLLDADTLIRADSTYYPLRRFPVFWEWLQHMGIAGAVKVPIEQYEEITVGKGLLVDWLNEEDIRAALLLHEEADPAIVAAVTQTGYAPDLNEAEQEEIGCDPFLIAYGYAAIGERFVVTFEVSAPSKQRAKRKVPDICNELGIPCGTLFDVIEALDFTTDWKPE